MLKKLLTICVAVFGIVCNNISTVHGQNTNPIQTNPVQIKLGINAKVAVPGTEPPVYATGGFNARTIKITKVSRLLVRGEDVYKVIKTRKKHRNSGVYEKSITDESYTDKGSVGYTFYNEKK
ncbi:MAG: hypothetical protein LBJ00_09150 [Planctomycetaceae bacterium]|jgi:hypothetical protein|nr:hypothetical protein [Planctomycetaceae bacterium]